MMSESKVAQPLLNITFQALLIPAGHAMAADAQRSHMEGKPAAFVAAADVVLEVDDQRFLAHTQLLSAESPVLAELLAEYAGSPPPGGELPVVALAKKGDTEALGTVPEQRCRTFAALLDTVYNPARRMTARWEVEQLKWVVSMAHVLQMDALLFLCDEVGARELARHFKTVSGVSWARGGARPHATAVGRTDTEWCRLGEKCGLYKSMAVALREALKKVTGAEKQAGVNADVVRGFIRGFGAPVRGVILDEMVEAMHPSKGAARFDDKLASDDPLAAKLRDAMSLGELPAWSQS